MQPGVWIKLAVLLPTLGVNGAQADCVVDIAAGTSIPDNTEVGCSTVAGQSTTTGFNPGPATGTENATVTVTGVAITLPDEGSVRSGIAADAQGTGNATVSVSNTSIDNQKATGPSLGINVTAGAANGTATSTTASLTLSGDNTITVGEPGAGGGTGSGGGTLVNVRDMGNATTTVSGTLNVSVNSGATSGDPGKDDAMETTVRGGTATLDMTGVTGPSIISVTSGNGLFIDSLPSTPNQDGGQVVVTGIAAPVTVNLDNTFFGSAANGIATGPVANAGMMAGTFGTGTVDVQGTSATINTTGPLADGIHAVSQLGAVTVNNAGPITTTGTASHGIEANTINSGYGPTIIWTGTLPAVVNTALPTGNVSVTNNGAITTTGGGSEAAASHGIYVWTKSVGTGASGDIAVENNTGGNITTSGDYSDAIEATTASAGGAAGSIAITNAAQLSAFGLSANGIAVDATGATGGTTVQIDNSGSITSSHANGIQATTRGGAPTLVITNESGGTISGVTGVDVGSGFTTAQVNNSGTITGSTAAVEFVDGTNSLNLNNGSTTNGNVIMGSGADVTTVYAGATITGPTGTGVPLFTSTGSLSSLIFSGYAGAANAISALQLVQFSNDADVTFSGADLHAAQLFQIDSGSTLAFSTNTGTLTGNVTNAGTLDYSAGDATYSITGDLINTGVVKLGSASGTPGNILTVGGNYQGGTGASVMMNTLLNAGGPLTNQFTDRLLIAGNATGTTTLLINSTGTGAPTPMNNVETASTGISVVQVAGSSTQGAFVLGNNGVVGNEPYIYHLNAWGPTSSIGTSNPAQADTRGSGNNWDYRLQNNYIEDDGSISEPGGGDLNPDGTYTPPGPDDNDQNEALRPQVAPQVPAYLTAPLALFQAGYLDIATLHQRLGEIRYDDDGSPLSPPASDDREVFARAYGGQFHYASNIGFTNYGYDASISAAAVQFGGTILRRENPDGIWRYGLAASFGHVWWSPDAVDGNSSGNLDRYTFYGTATYQAHSGWYADGVVFGGLFDGSVSTDTVGRASNMGGTTVGLSLESGYPFLLNRSGLSLEPQAQVVWQHLSFDTKTDANGIVNELGGQDSALLRLGFRLVQPMQLAGKYPLDPYFKFNFLQPLTGGGSAVIGRVPFDIGRNGSAVQIGAGVTSRFNDRLSAYGDALYQRRVVSYGSNGWQVNAGLRYTF